MVPTLVPVTATFCEVEPTLEHTTFALKFAEVKGVNLTSIVVELTLPPA